MCETFAGVFQIQDDLARISSRERRLNAQLAGVMAGYRAAHQQVANLQALCASREDAVADLEAQLAHLTQVRLPATPPSLVPPFFPV